MERHCISTEDGHEVLRRLQDALREIRGSLDSVLAQKKKKKSINYGGMLLEELN
jgi:hypothetical protein